MRLFPVKYQRQDLDSGGMYYIVAKEAKRAKDIAFKCIANSTPPNSEGPPRPKEHGEGIAQVWVRESWSQEVNFSEEGLVGAGSDVLIAKALVLYVERYQSLS